MRDELQTSLRERYPELFDQTDGTLPINRWGIEVGDGWYGIIDAVLDVAHWHCRDQGKRLTVIDCKQKFGTLRVMFRGDVDDHMRGAVDAALAVSARTCECCGSSGRFRESQAATRCDTCAKVG